MAAAICSVMSKGKHWCKSAGTKVSENKQGQRLCDKQGAEEVINTMKEIGIDISNNTRVSITPEMVTSSGMIIVMAQPETIPIFLSRSGKVVYWDVEDPYMQDSVDVRAIRNKIHSLVVQLLKKGNI